MLALFFSTSAPTSGSGSTQYERRVLHALAQKLATLEGKIATLETFGNLKVETLEAEVSSITKAENAIKEKVTAGRTNTHLFNQQGRIHGFRSRVRVGRGHI